MKTVYCVVYNVGGYAREDAPTPTVGGVYFDYAKARAHAMIVHGEISEINLDEMPKGIMDTALELGIF